MKPSFESVVCCLLITAFPSAVFGRGSPTRPDGPAPMMKTLGHVEPRTPITSLPYTIRTGGSYYLASNLVGVAGQNGITINANNVTLDLNGFALIGANGSFDGVSVSPAVSNVSVHNGTVIGWGGIGINAGKADDCQFEHLRLSNNGADGLVVGSNSTANDCVVSANSGNGIRVTGAGSRIDGNNLTSNAGYGLRVDGAGNLIVRNSAGGNTTANYSIAADSSYGEIVQAPSLGSANATAWANIALPSFCTGKPNGTACNDGNACTQTDTCQGGVCVGSNPVVCPASDQCHAAGVCNPGSGVCSNPRVVDGTACNDGNACTQIDTCQAGVCVGSDPVVCTPTDQCHAAGTCNPATGGCSNPIAADGTACDDGNACTQTDACEGGICVGFNPAVCPAIDQCHAAGTCDPGTGVCSEPIVADSTACDDGNPCTQNDTCQAGVCTGGTDVCANGPFQITSIVRTNGTDVLITWNTAGTNNIVQVTPGTGVEGSFSPAGFADLTNLAVTTAITNFLDVGAATNHPARYYRIRSPQ